MEHEKFVKMGLTADSTARKEYWRHPMTWLIILIGLGIGGCGFTVMHGPQVMISQIVIQFNNPPLYINQTQLATNSTKLASTVLWNTQLNFILQFGFLYLFGVFILCLGLYFIIALNINPSDLTKGRRQKIREAIEETWKKKGYTEKDITAFDKENEKSKKLLEE